MVRKQYLSELIALEALVYRALPDPIETDNEQRQIEITSLALSLCYRGYTPAPPPSGIPNSALCLGIQS